MPRFSIITVSKNNLSGLSATRESIVAQTFDGYEWIVIDGGSDDGTVAFLKETKAQFISEADHGLYDAMNKGIDRACGDYVLFLNAGDTLASHDVLEQLATVEADFIYGDSYEGGNLKPARSHKRIAYGMFTHHQAMLYRATLLSDIRYDTYFKIAADYDFTARAIQSAKAICYVPVPICDFEQGGLSQSQASCGRCEQFIIRKRRGMANILTNSAIYLTQICLWRLRMIFPGFYWRVRSWRNTARA